MTEQLLTSIIGGIGFAIAATAAYLYLRKQLRWAQPVLRIAAILAIGANSAYFIHAIYTQESIETFRHNFDSTLLLATLVGLVGIGAHLSSTLRGLDGFLFIVAAVVNFSSLSVLHYPSNPFMDRSWFVSHPLAFSLSATCFIASGVAGVVYLIMHSVLRRKYPTTLVGHVAPLESLERFGRWMLTIGFPLFTYVILTGICGVAHVKDPGQTTWLRDPMIVFSLIIWIIYALMVLCVLFRPQIRGRRAAMLSACGMVLIVVGFWVIDFVSPLHR